jgi:hypothetical protein
MKFNLLITIALPLGYLISCQPATVGVTGKWMRSGKQATTFASEPVFGSCGDMELIADSSFRIHGNSSTVDTTTPGWSVCQEITGRWELEPDSLLTFWLDGESQKLFLRYRIRKLTQEEMVLHSVLSQSETDNLHFTKSD